MVGSVEDWYDNRDSIEVDQDSAVVVDAAVDVVLVCGIADHEEKTLFVWRQRTYDLLSAVRP